jgi:hypothetical protein
LPAFDSALGVADFDGRGLFKHYWVVVKLVLTVLATAALFLHQFTVVAEAARLASNVAASEQGLLLRQLGLQLRADAGLALWVLVEAVIVAVTFARGAALARGAIGMRAQQRRTRGVRSNWAALKARHIACLGCGSVNRRDLVHARSPQAECERLTNRQPSFAGNTPSSSEGSKNRRARRKESLQ